MVHAIIYSLIILFAITRISGHCPEQGDLLKPCYCNDNSIYCTGNNDINLDKIFSTLSAVLTKPSKYFERFLLQNSYIKELKENTFKDINFGEIHIGLCDILNTIDKNAFKGTDGFTTRLEIFDNKNLTSKDNSIFEALNNFKSIEMIRLSNLNIEEIPSNAFKNKQDNLTHIYFTGSSFVKIGSNAFSSLKNLSVLSFEQVKFKIIPEDSFAFNQESNRTLILNFASNPYINSSTFAVKSLAHIKRPTKILFGSSQFQKEITYLDEKVFEPFLSDNENTIDLLKEEFNCTDCRNQWIGKNNKILSKVLHLSCSNGRSITDPDNFKNCIE